MSIEIDHITRFASRRKIEPTNAEYFWWEDCPGCALTPRAQCSRQRPSGREMRRPRHCTPQPCRARPPNVSFFCPAHHIGACTV
jgi:hypothetical protein